MLVHLFLALAIGSNIQAMVFHPEQPHKRFSKGTVSLKLSPALYTFFAARLQEFDQIEQTTYDTETHRAFALFKNVVDRNALEDRTAFLNFLKTDTKPRRGHMHRIFFVLNAFVKLEKILTDSHIFQFAPDAQAIRRNHLFDSMPMCAPDIIEYYASIEFPLHACAYLARIPVLRYC